MYQVKLIIIRILSKIIRDLTFIRDYLKTKFKKNI